MASCARGGCVASCGGGGCAASCGGGGCVPVAAPAAAWLPEHVLQGVAVAAALPEYGAGSWVVSPAVADVVGGSRPAPPRAGARQATTALAEVEVWAGSAIAIPEAGTGEPGAASKAIRAIRDATRAIRATHCASPIQPGLRRRK